MTATTQAVATNALIQAAPLVHDAHLVGFSMIEWRQAFEAATLAESSAAAKILQLVLAAHGKVDLEAAREAILHSFAGAVMAQTPGAEFEACLQLKSVLNRTADAMAILKCKELPAVLPNGLQGAAKACREANPKTPRKPRAGGSVKVKPPKANASAMEYLLAALEALREECGEDSTALEIVAELSDLATTLADSLKPDASEQQAA